MNRSLILVVLVAALLLGCTQMSVDEIAKKMQEKWDSVTDCRGVERATITINGQQKTTEYEFIFKKPNKFWMHDRTNGILMVSNGSTLWTYDNKSNTVTVMEKISSHTSSTGTIDYGAIVKDMLERYDVKLLGSEEVAGKDCYVLLLKPKNETINLSIKMWVEKDYWMPLKMEMSDGIKVTTEYLNIEINTGVSDDVFEFKPPEGAKIIKKEPVFKRFSSVEEAQKHAPFKILTPSYTAGCELKSVSIISNVLVLTYSDNSGTEIVITESLNQSLPEEGEDVTVGDTEGKYTEMFGIGSVAFKKGDLLITVSGKIEKEELIKIAESIN